MYILDTNIVSRLDPRRYDTARDLVAWIRRNGGLLFLSVVTLLEIETGILKLRRDGQERRADEYDALRRTIETDFGDRLLPIDAIGALAMARLAEAIRPTVIDWKDLAIAATAQVHGLIVLTHNLRHFLPTGVPVHDPLDRLPPDGLP